MNHSIVTGDMSQVLICLLPNVSAETITEEYWETNAPVVAVFMAIFFVVALVLNSVILHHMVKNRHKLLRAPPHVILFSLSISDLLLTLLIMPVSVITAIAGDFPFGSSDNTRCRVCQYGVIFSILSISSLHHIALLSLDRFLYVRVAVGYERHVTKIRTLFAVAAVWFISLLIGIQPLFGFGAIGYSSSIGACVPAFYGETSLTKNSYYLLLFFVEALIPISVITFCNVGLLYMAWKHVRIRAIRRRQYSTDNLNISGTVEAKVNHDHRKQQLQLIKVFGAIFIGNLITWAPVLCLSLVSQIIDFDIITSEVIAFVYMSYISYALIHPLLECCLMSDVRKKIKDLLYIMICSVHTCKKHLLSREDASIAENSRKNESV